MQANTLPFQPKFKVLIAGENVTNEIEGDISVSYELQMPIVCTLQFAMTNQKITSLGFGVSVRVWAGYERENEYSGPNIIQSAQEFGLIFSGEVRKKGISANANGIVTLNVTAYDRSYSRSGYSKHIYRYPGVSPTAERTWIQKDSLTTLEIVQNLVKEMGKELSDDLGDITNITWTKTAPLVQGDMSDMAFLTLLAERSGCYVWSDYVPTDDPAKYKEVIHFKSKKAVVQNTDVSFVYLSRWKELPTLYDFESQDFKPNRLHIINANIEVDPLIYGFPATRITDFNIATGENEEKFVTYDEKDNTIIYWKLDEAKVQALMDTPEGRAEADRLQDFGAFSIPWEEAKKYFTAEVIKSDIIDQIDAPVFGINMSGTCRGSISIRPFRRYQIDGVPAIHNSLLRRKFAFFLHSMTHTISPAGFTTTLNFKG